MALISCAECAKQISDKAQSCPGCGAPIDATLGQNDAVHSSAGIPDVHQEADGRWAYKNMRFSSHEAAKLYAQSRVQKPAPVPPVASNSSWPMWFKLLGVAIPVLAIASCIGNAGKGGASNTSAANGFDWNDALYLCQSALKRVSRDPEKAEIPYVPNSGSGDDFYFAWGAGTKMARMRNGLGLEVAASASCIVSKSQKRITSLTLDGKTIL